MHPMLIPCKRCGSCATTPQQCSFASGILTQQVTIETRNYDSGNAEAARRNPRILASPDLSLAAPTALTPPTAPESVHSKHRET